MKGQLSHWSDGFARLKLLLPRKGAKVGDKRFTLNCAAVYSELVSLAAKEDCVEHTSAAHLSKLLSGLDPQTISRALDLLVKAGLIRVFRDASRMNVHVLPLTEDHQRLFAPAATTTADTQPPTADKLVRPNFKHSMHGDMYDYCVCHSIPHDVAAKIVVRASKAWNCDFSVFCVIFDEAEAQNHQNVMAGNVNTKHCGDLLLWKLNERIKKQESVFGVTSLIQNVQEPREETEEEKAERHRSERQHREDVLSNPLHPDHKPFTATDIVRRVAMPRTDAGRLHHQFGRYISKELEKKTGDFLRASDMSIDVSFQTMAQALNSVNEYYEREDKARVEEFEAALDAALMKFDLAPMFQTSEVEAKSGAHIDSTTEESDTDVTQPTRPVDMAPDVFEELIRLGQERNGEA